MTRHSRGGCWNMERDRDRASTARTAFDLMHIYRLDWLLVEESSDYLAELNRQAGSRGCRVLDYSHPRGTSNTAILVRNGVHSGPGYEQRMTWHGWTTVRGGHTPSKYMTTVLLAGWLRLGAVHFPPTAHFRRHRLTGPLRRVGAYIQHARSVVRFSRRNRRRARLFAGDWNNTPQARGRYSPHWIARKAGLHVAAPVHGTHAGHHDDPIDFALYGGCHVTARRARSGGSDHRLVVFEVTED